MENVIVTGRSGAGISTALNILEDFGYYCVDNLPEQLIEKFMELEDEDSPRYDRVALGIDVRNGESLKDLSSTMDRLRAQDSCIRILFLDARDDVLIRRFKESRRPHPLAGNGRIEEGMAREHEMIDSLRGKADYIIDTSEMLTRDLHQQLEKIFICGSEYKNLMITVLSFGFKFGLPSDSDLVFDVRFLPNPYYVPELRNQTGNNPGVRSYVLNSEITQTFLTKLEDLLRFLIPNYIKEGKNRLVISIGCTGGRHRSVTIANEIYRRLRENSGPYGITLNHRDLGRKDNHVFLD